jgi:GT2 family glycosyltransferase
MAVSASEDRRDHALVTVVIPTYNTASFLHESVASVLQQDVPKRDVEIVVVDDGSADDVPSALAPFGESVRYLRQANAGAAAARNRGVSVSCGRYVTFLDADDYWLPGRLSAMLELAALSPSLVTTDFYYETAGVRASKSAFVNMDSLSFFDLPAGEQYRCGLEAGMFSVMTLLSRQLFDDMGGFDETLRFSEDYDLWLRCLASGIPIRAVKRPLAIYRYLRDGASSEIQSAERVACRIKMLQRHRAHVSPVLWQSLQDKLAYLSFREAIRHRRWGNAIVRGAQLGLKPRFCLDLIQRRLGRE